MLKLILLLAYRFGFGRTEVQITHTQLVAFIFMHREYMRCDGNGIYTVYMYVWISGWTVFISYECWPSVWHNNRRDKTRVTARLKVFYSAAAGELNSMARSPVERMDWCCVVLVRRYVAWIYILYTFVYGEVFKSFPENMVRHLVVINNFALRLLCLCLHYIETIYTRCLNAHSRGRAWLYEVLIWVLIVSRHARARVVCESSAILPRRELRRRAQCQQHALLHTHKSCRL